LKRIGIKDIYYMIKRVKLFEDFINEREEGHQYDDISGELLKPKRGKWLKINPKKYPELSNEFFDLINIAYSSIGGHVKIKSPDDVFSDPDWTFWKGVDLNGSPDLDLIIWGQHTKYGIKFSGVGHDGEKVSTREYLEAKAKSLLKKGFYGEVSGVLADIMMDKYGVPSVDNKEDVQDLLKGKDIEWHGKDPENPNRSGDGWYTRNLGGSSHKKIMIGKPKI
tara:strand:- start:591 stop:1256 length:666 start_codon:yes stop_codon:yes gene_type:complete